MECFGSPGIGPGKGGTIELALQPGHETVVGRLVGTGPADWRHHASAQLPNDFFPDLGVVGNLAQIEDIKRELGRTRTVVVAGDAVSVEEGAVGPDSRGGGSAGNRRANGRRLRLRPTRSKRA
jgi:hypothetical protein